MSLAIHDETAVGLHLTELHKLLRTSALILCVTCIFWSFFVSQVIHAWIDFLPLQTGPTNENLSIYGPYDWLEVRWALVLVLGFTSLLPVLSIQLYRFSRSGLYSMERNWLTAVLTICTSIVPIAIIIVWVYVIPAIFDLAESAGTIDRIGVSYDASAILSLALGASWILIVWAVTVVTIGLARLNGLVEDSGTRFRYRILAISTGSLVLLLPLEFDGLRLVIAFATAITADAVSRNVPIVYPNWRDRVPDDSSV
tara:strand:+ start:3096 stop:3860 length:765 start_codon:yes stop_codon:yes gene_type:complete